MHAMQKPWTGFSHYALKWTFKSLFIYVICSGTEIQKDIQEALIYWLSSQTSAMPRAEPGWARGWDLNLSCCVVCKKSVTWILTCCIPECILTGSWHWEQIKALNSGTSMYNANIPSNFLFTLSTTNSEPILISFFHKCLCVDHRKSIETKTFL